MSIKVGIVVLNYNSFQDTVICVSSLLKQDYSQCSIYIVDNASTNFNDFEKLKNLLKNDNIHYIQNEKNTGYSSGNNLGLRTAIKDGADWCLIVNPDVVIEDSGYVSRMISSTTTYLDGVVFGSKVILPNGENQNPLRELNYFEELFWPITTWIDKRANKNRYHIEMSNGYCEKLSGCCVFIKSSFLKQINYLDENVFLYSEEAILTKQVKRKNKKLVYINDVYVNHNHIVSEKGNVSNRMKVLLNSRIYYLKSYSSYRGLAKMAIVFSKKLQRFIWVHRKN